MRLSLLMAIGLVWIEGCGGPIQGRPQSEVPSPVNADSSGEAAFDDFEQEYSQRQVTVCDPLEGWNRLMFQINDRLYFWVFKPVAQGYSKVAPQPVRIGVRNFFRNITTGARFVNCMAQGEYDDGGKEFGRFMVNTTWGILGVGDPAKDHLGLEVTNDEDTGQTLGRYGVGQGVFIMWPVWGPSTMRDTAGLVVDQFLNPVGYVRPLDVYAGLYVFRITNDYSLHLGDYEELKSSAVEPYTALRDAYLQYRAKKVQE